MFKPTNIRRLLGDMKPHLILSAGESTLILNVVTQPTSNNKIIIIRSKSAAKNIYAQLLLLLGFVISFVPIHILDPIRCGGIEISYGKIQLIYLKRTNIVPTVLDYNSTKSGLLSLQMSHPYQM